MKSQARRDFDREAKPLARETGTHGGENEGLRQRNGQLKAEVKDLKQGLTALEERARHDLGMIGSGETFYQVVDVADLPPVRTPLEPVSTEAAVKR